jgi:cardiolipin synthase A/B
MSTNPPCFTARCLIFDQYMMVSGSTNFDMRSFELTDDASLNVYNLQFALQMAQVFEEDLRLSTPYSRQRWAETTLVAKSG